MAGWEISHLGVKGLQQAASCQAATAALSESGVQVDASRSFAHPVAPLAPETPKRDVESKKEVRSGAGWLAGLALWRSAATDWRLSLLFLRCKKKRVEKATAPLKYVEHFKFVSALCQ